LGNQQNVAANFTVSVDVLWTGRMGYQIALSRPFADPYSSTGSQTGIALGLSNGVPVIALMAGPDRENRSVVAASALNPGQWYTLKAAYNGITVSLFVDGVAVGETTFGSVVDVSQGATKWIVGREFACTTSTNVAAANGFFGRIDNPTVSAGVWPEIGGDMWRFTFSEGSGFSTVALFPGGGSAWGSLRGRTTTFQGNFNPIWSQGSDPVMLSFTSTVPASGPANMATFLRPGSQFTLPPSSTFSRPGYSLSAWTLGSSMPQLSPGTVLTMPQTPVTYYSVWSATNQTVTFQAGLGSGSNVSQSAATGSQLTLPQYSAIGFTRTGFRQSGWTLAGITYSQGSEVNVPSGGLTLVAAWLPEDQTVTYVLNGGTGTPPSQAPVGTGSTITAADASSFTRAGYRFTGWTDGGVINYQPGDSYTVSAQPIQFTAQWRALSQTISYRSGAGASGAVPPSAAVPTDGSFAVAARGSLVRAGYTFEGWRDQLDVVYVENATYTVGSSAVSLTAVWSADTHTVTYVNSADSSGTPPTQSDVVTDDTFTVASGSTLTLPGYTFSGWTDGRVDALSRPLVYQPGDSYRAGVENIQLSPVWTPNPHAVSYRFAGGETGTLPSSFSSVTAATFTVPSATAFSRPGYTFAGWRDTTGLYAGGSTYTTATEDVVLTAEWTPNPHTVTYGAGLGSGAVPTQADVVTDATFTVAGTGSVGRDGYTFAGWKDGAGATYQPGETYTVGTSPVAFTAQWIANTYNVRYFLNRAATGTPPTATTATTEQTFATAGSSGFSLPGYNLLGWFDGEFTTTAGDNYTQGVGDTSFYTSWQAQSHSVTYLAGGASGSVPTQANVATDASFDLSSASGLTRDGYTFAGWAADGSLYPENFSYTAGTASMTFTASWSPTAHQIVFLAGRGASGTAPASRDLLTDDSFVVTTPNLTLPGYDFDGWVDCTDSPPGTDVYRVGDSISATGSTPDLVLYCATWNPQVHSITYVANGADGATPSQANTETDDSFTVASGSALTREGYTFGGWFDGTSTYQEADTYIVGATNVTLTAVWDPVFVNVSYLVGGGAAGTPPTQGPLAYGSSLAVASADGLSLDGQYFWGWTDGQRVYQPGETLERVTTDLDMAATWGDTPLVTLPDSGLNPWGAGITFIVGSLFMGVGGLILVLRRRRGASG
jgi:uncharacterized repeat protein (TIGR02543 family)